MPTIFDGLRKSSNDDIIEQIALLETINITNISKPIAQKAKKKTVNIINFFGSKIGRNHMIQEPEVKEICTLIDEKKDELKNCTRTELDERLLNVLREKYKNDIKNPTEDEISIGIIEEASKLYKFREYSTPNQKADNIYLKYCEKLEEKAKEYLNEQPLIDLKETTDSIEEIFKNMNEEQKKDFEQSVDIEKLTLLNIGKKVERQLFTRLVWLSVKSYGGSFKPKKEILPSFVENEKEVEMTNQEKDLKNLQEKSVELKNEIKSSKDKIDSIENSLKEKNSSLKRAIENKSELKEDIINLGKTNVKLEQGKELQENKLKEIKIQMETAVLEKLDSLMEEFKQVKFNIIDINNRISDLNIEIAYKNQLIKDTINEIAGIEETIKNIGIEFQKFKMEANNLLKTYNENKKAVNKKEVNKKNEIFERWSKFFDKFIFQFNDLSNVVNFSREELLHIEECLYELHHAKDPKALSMGILEDTDNKKEEYQYIDISFDDKFEIEIQYKVLDNEEKNVHIVEITTEF